MSASDYSVAEYRGELISSIRDASKDAYGSRVNLNWEVYSVAELEALAESYFDAARVAIDREREIEIEKVKSFERAISEVMRLGAPDRESAVRWLIDAESLDSIDRAYGDEHLRRRWGLPYNYDLWSGANVIARVS